MFKGLKFEDGLKLGAKLHFSRKWIFRHLQEGKRKQNNADVTP